MPLLPSPSSSSPGLQCAGASLWAALLSICGCHCHCWVTVIMVILCWVSDFLAPLLKLFILWEQALLFYIVDENKQVSPSYTDNVGKKWVLAQACLAVSPVLFGSRWCVASPVTKLLGARLFFLHCLRCDILFSSTCWVLQFCAVSLFRFRVRSLCLPKILFGLAYWNCALWSL